MADLEVVVMTEGEKQATSSPPLTKPDFEALARFRFGIRRYLRVSEEIVRGHGVTPQHYQLLLALMGFPGREWATVRELADLIQLRHHSVVELINRAQKEGLVQRAAHPTDARAVRVSLTGKGERILARLSAAHRDELRRVASVFTHPFWPNAASDHDPGSGDPVPRVADPDGAGPGVVDQNDVVDRLERWQQFGGIWRVASRTARTVTFALCRCDGGEEVERLTSNDPSVLRWLAENEQ